MIDKQRWISQTKTTDDTVLDEIGSYLWSCHLKKSVGAENIDLEDIWIKMSTLEVGSDDFISVEVIISTEANIALRMA